MADATPAELAQRVAELEAFTPTAARINALPAPLRRFIYELEQLCDPPNAIRDAILWRETADALAVRVRELEAELAGNRPGLARAVERIGPEDAGRHPNLPTLDRAGSKR